MSAPATDPILLRLAEAQAEGLAPNAKRFFRFLGHVPELQTLGMRTKFEQNVFAHPTAEERAVELLEEVEAKRPNGAYVVMNVVDDAVRSRASSNRWHPQKKGESTTDADITHRAAAFIDVDWARPKGTSTTETECVAALETTSAIVERLARSIPRTSLGIGHSGNCGSVFVALDMLPEQEARFCVRELVLILDLLFTSEHIQEDRNARNGIDIDTSVTDAKRLVPAFGTTKRKGAEDLEERPHRRTAFVCAEHVDRLDLGQLEDLITDLRADLSMEQLTVLDKAMGRSRPEARQSQSYDGDDVFARAKACSIVEVLSWLGLGTEDAPVCPGCGLSDSGVAVVKNGLKCSHDRCSQKGHSKGFRTTIDCVIEKRGLTPLEAVREMGARFGFEVPESRAKQQEPKNETPPPPPKAAEPTAVPDLVSICRAQPGRYLRIPTGIDGLDAATRGGLRTGNLNVFGGAPGGHKTSLLARVVYLWARDGVPTQKGRQPVYVSVVAADESRDGFLSRFGQIERVDRDELDDESLDVSGPAWERVAAFVQRLDGRLALWDPREDGRTVEQAADELAKRPGDVTRRVLLVDSLQARSGWGCDQEGADPRAVVNGRLAMALRMARKLKLCVVITSELARAAYRQKGGDSSVSKLATFKESGGVEYDIDQGFVLERIDVEAGEKPLVDLHVVKTRWGQVDEVVRLKREGWLSYVEEGIPEEESKEEAREKVVTKLVLELVKQLRTRRTPIQDRQTLNALVRGERSVVVAAVSRAIADGWIVKVGKSYVVADSVRTGSVNGEKADDSDES